MIIGESKLKFIVLCLMILLFFGFCNQNLLAESTTVELPGPEQVKSFWQNIKEGTWPMLQKIKDSIGRGVDGPMSFFKNIGTEISKWWSHQAGSWVKHSWSKIALYFNKEIKIE